MEGMGKKMDERRRARSGATGEQRPRRPRQFVPARELAAALADAPSIDYEQLRADLDTVIDQDPTPRIWVDE